MIDLKEIKNKTFKNDNIYYLIIILIIFFLDRYSKLYILKNFSDRIYYVNELINYDLVWNTGIGFGLFNSSSLFIYNSITLLIACVIILLVYLTIKSKKIDKIAFSIIIGGAIGNFYDRLIYNAVPDFIDLHYKNFHWFTFNLADIFITFGVFIFLLKGFVKD